MVDTHGCSSHSKGSVITYISRNAPHPRMLSLIRGLNNAPVCAVRNSFFGELPHADKTGIPEQIADQERVPGGNATGDLAADSCLSRLEAFMQRWPGSSQFAAEHGNIPQRTQSNPTTPASLEKLLKKRPQTSAQPAATQGVFKAQPSPERISSSHSPRAQQNADFVLSYLHRELNVLEKLKKIFLTDSLTEIQEWLSKASTKEKLLVSRLIYSEMNDKSRPNSQPQAVQAGAAENMNTPSLLTPQSPPQRGPEGEINSRPPTTGSESSQNMKHEGDKDGTLSSRLKNRCPAHADTAYPEKSCGRKSAGNGKDTELPSHDAQQQGKQTPP